MAIEISVRTGRLAGRRGQALMELAVGLFAVALVVSALCGFALYIVASLRAQNELRADLGSSGGSSKKSGSVDVGTFAADYLFPKQILKIEEKVEMPSALILK